MCPVMVTSCLACIVHVCLRREEHTNVMESLAWPPVLALTCAPVPADPSCCRGQPEKSHYSKTNTTCLRPAAGAPLPTPPQPPSMLSVDADVMFSVTPPLKVAPEHIPSRRAFHTAARVLQQLTCDKTMLLPPSVCLVIY